MSWGRVVLAKYFARKNENSLYETLEEKQRKNSLGIKLTMLKIQSLEAHWILE